jgi:hypothetical protein
MPEMTLEQKSWFIEALARMAAQLAGRNAEEHVKVAWGEIVAFEGPMWRYPDFVLRAEAAYIMLAAPYPSEGPA